jgi:nucleotide-binding universal stress UspA family protein
MYKNILIPTDGSELAGKAVQDGMGLAKALGATDEGRDSKEGNP